MAKKKSSKKTETEEVSDEQLEDSLLGGDEGAPKEPEVVEEKKKKSTKTIEFNAETAPIEAPSEVPSDAAIVPSLPEEETKKKDYKYMKVKLLSEHFNTYRIEFENESHGFLNLLNTKVLNEKGITFSAYKETSIDPPVLTVVTDGSVTAMKVLNNVAESMKKDFNDLKKAVSQSIK
jgi:DNA-directed RNA polymerase subunit L